VVAVMARHRIPKVTRERLGSTIADTMRACPGLTTVMRCGGSVSVCAADGRWYDIVVTEVVPKESQGKCVQAP